MVIHKAREGEGGRMKTAEFIKNCTEDFRGDARLYKLSHLIKYDEPWDKTDAPAKRILGDNTPSEICMVAAILFLICTPPWENKNLGTKTTG